MMPKFSIAIPAYKAIFLHSAIESVLRQTYPDFELIILNDCSPEPVEEIVLSFSDSRIRYLENSSNVGAIDVVDNWNKCLNVARGEFFLCMGDDDELDEGCLSEYARLIQEYPDQIIFHGQTIVVDENGDDLFVPLSRPEWESAYELAYFRGFGRKQYVGDFLYQTATLKRMGGYFKLPAAWGSDDITALLAARKSGIVNTHKIVFRYRQSSYSISSSRISRVKLDAIDAEESWYHSFIMGQPQDEKADLRYLDLLRKECGKVFKKKRMRIIADDMMSNPFHLFKWIRQSAKFGLTKKMVIYAWIVATRDRASIKYQQLKRV